MRKIILSVLFSAAMLFSAVLSAADDFVMSDIKVSGLHRISLGTVLNYVPVKKGDTMDQAKAARVIRELYATGFFQNVALERDGNVLIIDVVERATIGSISFSGNSEISKEQIQMVLNQIGLVKGQVFQRSSLEQFVNQLKQEYNNRGKYNAVIYPQVTRLSQNRVGIKITISEGRSARIKEINIIGNKAFSDKTLLKQFTIKTMGFFTYFTRQDQYSKEELNASLEALRSYYMNRGYARFRIDSTQVLLSPDKKYVYIDVKVTEGNKYTFSGHRLEGKLVLPEDELEELVAFKKGDVFSRRKVTATINTIGDAYGNIGYGFPDIKANPDINDKEKTVFITFVVHPGRHVYVRRINFKGNTKTGDYVLRRAMRQDEGSILTLKNIKESERQLRMLGYLKNVDVKTVKVPETNNQVDMNVSVEEAPSAEATVSIGYGTNGPELNAGIDQRNFMGTGKTLGFHFNTSYYGSNYTANYYNPYYTDSGIGRGITGYFSHIDPDKLDIATYTSDKMGGAVTYNFPVTNHNSFQLGYGYQYLTINSYGDPAVTQIQDFVDNNGTDFNEIRLTGGWAYNTYDQKIFPTRGVHHELTGLVALPATSSSLSYYKTGYSFHGYQPLYRGFIVTARGNVSYGNTFDDQGLPFFENYFAGGIAKPGEVRGYENYSLGPKDSNNNALGGNFMVVGSLGLILPEPLSRPNERTSLFMDAGNVYGYNLPEAQKGTDSGPIRYSTGVAVDWQSPFGPLSFSLATPLNIQPNDDTSYFQFTVISTL